MTPDNFAEAARAEAWRRHPAPVDVETGEPVDDWGLEEQSRRDFREGAEWARTYLAARETDAEVEAARKVWEGPRWARTSSEHARAALSAARAVRQEKR